MAFRLDVGEAGSGVQRVVVEQVARAMRSLITASAGSDDDLDDGVHDARKRLKRVRAVLRLVRDPIDDDRYRAENARYRDVGRHLAPVRDARVTRDLHVEHIGPSEHLEAELRAARQTVREPEVVGKLLRDLADGLGAVGDWPLEGSDADLFGEGLRRTYRSGRRAMRVEERSPSAEQRHEWRKAVKYHWHHLELLAGAWPEVVEARAAETHRLADLLGDEHDLVLLGTLLPRPERKLENRAADLRQEALELGRRVYAEPPRDLVARFTAWWEASGS
jgi:CHAD domain-containing protein